MPAAWPKDIKSIQDGEAVNASVTNRPSVALQNRTDYLKARMDAGSDGQALFDFGAAVGPNVLVGQPVYWDDVNQWWDQALAAVEDDLTSETVVTKKTAECEGLLFAKTGPNTGDVVLRGLVQLPSINNATGLPVTPGRYYLSSQQAGLLTQQRPPVSVPVCYVLGTKGACDPGPWLIVDPQVRDFLEDHIHYRFELTCKPAGQVHALEAIETGRHVIHEPDPTLPGWLPADHPSFNGTAPTGAIFGYNMAVDQPLSRVWPPIPVSAAALIWDKGQDHLGGTEVPLGRNGLAVCNAFGIWWMSDCLYDVPWPADYDTTGSSSMALPGSLSSSAADVPACPPPEQMQLAVVYVRMVFATDKTVVTSLQPAAGSPITVLNCSGSPATTGDLYLGLLIDALIDNNDAVGGNVLKTIANNFHLTTGWVAEGLIAGSDHISLTATHQRYEVPGDDTSAVVYQGLVTVDVNLTPQATEDSPQIVRLSDAEERYYLEIPCLGLPTGRDSEIVLRYDIPPVGLPVNALMYVRTVLFGRATGTLPALTLQYKVLPRPVDSNGNPLPQALPATWLALGFNSAIAVTANTAIEIASDSFAINPGDTVLVSISRNVSDGYAGEVDIIRMGRIITS